MLANKMHRNHMKCDKSDISVRTDKMLFSYVNQDYPELTYLLTL